MNLLQKLARSSEGARLIAAVEARERDERASQIQKLEAEITRAEATQEEANAVLGRKIDAAREVYGQARKVFLDAENTLRDLDFRRLQASFAHDANVSQLRAQLEALQREAVEVAHG